MENKRNLIQCVICSTVFTKDGYPNKYFNYDDKLIYGCTQCKRGNWDHHSRYTLTGLKVSEIKDIFNNERDDTGYLDIDRGRVKAVEGIKWDDLVPYPRPNKKKVSKEAFCQLKTVEK